ncbi:class I SAM-dependent methyltransferase [Flavobacteriaceae bacterium]|jgi:methyltransferase (TIGR00027 family)|nr:class I SAM-dependent methyltransferase [Flavobacteriaceae bacterium]MEC8612062.1 class I SAM-dependent methyltransferase [Bacteroidota bacterium]|tara:strand:- start:82 stop:990 length:909 start_codon:yes stop_codon:yes gene_type:complete
MGKLIFRKDGTAQGVAKQRLIESLAKPDRRIIYDPYAKNFVLGANIIKLMGHRLSVWLGNKIIPGMHEHLISRTRYIDDLIEKSTFANIEQYVILGAGYDSRAHRLKLPSKLKIFEVDQSEVQELKRLRLPDNMPNRESITYVDIDFNHQSLKEQLINVGFDQNKSTIFTLEGVSQYISREALDATLKEVADLNPNSNSKIFISYVNKLLKEDSKACFGKGYSKPEKAVSFITNSAAKMGEPWISFYSAEEIESILSQNNFTLIENKTLADLNSKYFTPVGRTIPENHIFKLEHFVIAESKK